MFAHSIPILIMLLVAASTGLAASPASQPDYRAEISRIQMTIKQAGEGRAFNESLARRAVHEALALAMRMGALADERRAMLAGEREWRKRELLNANARLEQQAYAAKIEIAHLKDRIEELEKRVRSATPASSQPDAPDIAVTQVADDRSVILNGGQRAGLAVGSRFWIYRGTSLIGETVITAVAPDQATGRIIRSVQPIEVGDRAGKASR